MQIGISEGSRVLIPALSPAEECFGVMPAKKALNKFESRNRILKRVVFGTP